MSYCFYRILHGHTVLDSFFGMQLWGHLDSFIGTEVVHFLHKCTEGTMATDTIFFLKIQKLSQD